MQQCSQCSYGTLKYSPKEKDAITVASICGFLTRHDYLRSLAVIITPSVTL